MTPLAPDAARLAQYVVTDRWWANPVTMDRKVIEEKQLVERYLTGRLPPPEARFFEQLVRDSPDLADELGLPESLKRTMRLLDETGTEWREQPPRFWHRPWLPISLIVAMLFAIAFAIIALGARSRAEAKYVQLKHEAEQGLLVAPTLLKSLLIPVARPEARSQLYAVGSRAIPTLAELHLDIGYATGAVYSVTIKRDDGTFWARIDNLLRDSNGQLRLTVNSGAFAAGVYNLEIEASNQRGETHAVGHLQIRVDAN